MPQMETKEALFNDLVNQHYSYLLRIGINLTNNSSDAEDILQEALLRAWLNIDTLRKLSSAKSWLKIILRNENARRFEKKRPKLVSKLNEVIEEIPSEYCSFLNEINYCNNILKKIPDKYSKPLCMQVVHGYTHEEIGSKLGITANTVSIRIFRAKSKLRSILNGEENYNENSVLNNGSVF